MEKSNITEGEKNMAATEAQKRAMKKYIDGKLDSIMLRVPKGEKENIRKSAENCGMSLNSYIYTVVKKEMEQENIR